MLLFWTLALPIGLAIVERPLSLLRKTACLFGVAGIYILLWIIPDMNRGLSYTEAGYQLRSEVSDSIKIAGDWRSGVPITLWKYGWNLNRLENNYFDINPKVSKDSLLLKTGEKSLIITLSKKGSFRRWLSGLGFHLLRNQEFNEKMINGSGIVTKIFENESVEIYKWDKKAP
jgi:hypothetical protein